MKKENEEKLRRFALFPYFSQKGFLNKTEFGIIVRKEKPARANDFINVVDIVVVVVDDVVIVVVVFFSTSRFLASLPRSAMEKAKLMIERENGDQRSKA